MSDDRWNSSPISYLSPSLEYELLCTAHPCRLAAIVVFNGKTYQSHLSHVIIAITGRLIDLLPYIHNTEHTGVDSTGNLSHEHCFLYLLQIDWTRNALHKSYFQYGFPSMEFPANTV